MELLTNSRMSTAKTCLRKAQLMYELGLRPDREPSPLRMGAAIHVGLDWRAKGAPVEEAVLKATAGYLLVPAWAEPDEWELERQIVSRLIVAYFWRYSDEPLESVASELSFELPIRNPDSGRISRNFHAAGVIDRIVRLGDGRLAVLETKTTGDDISSGSDYWARLRLDQQISLYVLAARQLGYDVETVLYDVIRKPSIRPRKITKIEASEIRCAHTYYREPASGEATAGMQETAALFGSRLLSDIGNRPEFYFARREIPRLEADLDEFRRELWSQSKLIRESQLHNFWPRNSNACLANGRCAFCDLCFEGINPENGTPPGYVKMTNVHPELERGIVHDHGQCQAASAETASEGCAVAGLHAH